MSESISTHRPGFTCNIVEICNVDDPRAKFLVETNKDLGHRIYQYRGALLTILVVSPVYRGRSEFVEVADGLYIWRGDHFEHVSSC